MKRRTTDSRVRFRRIPATLICLLTVLQFIAACSVLQTQKPVTELASLQNQRSVSERLALQEMEEIDTLIKLDNRWLAKQFEDVIQASASSIDTHDFRKIKTYFFNNFIQLEILSNIKDEYGNTINAKLWGDILLKYRGHGLEWQPRFSQVQITSKDFTFDNINYTEASPELAQGILQYLNSHMTRAIIGSKQDTMPLNPVPLGEIQVGATLPGFTESSARSTQPLKGVFMVANSAVLVDSSSTSVALDLSFIPDLSVCPADVTVSVAEFVRDVKSREPVGIARSIQNTADVSYFYSVITGAKRPLTIIHYWFADGLPLTVEELSVGPSERWRTWSARGAANGTDASMWEVLVVEKESGCILTSKSIRAREQESPVERAGPDQARESFRELKTAFDTRTSGFSITDDKPGIALVEVKRSFLREVLKATLEDLNIDADFNDFTSPVLNYFAQLQAFDTEDIICESHDCPPAPVCKTSLAQCKRLRDSRDCSSCQFRNPLNNRCVSEAIDPLCEAARNRQNVRYDIERNACISRAEQAKQECDRLNEQALRSCQIESGFEKSACESAKAGLKVFNREKPLANVSAMANAGGQLSVNFSNFLIEGDLERLQLDISLRSRLHLDGELKFKPTTDTQPLDECIAAWNAAFKNRISDSSEVNNLVSNFELQPDMLTAKWSGFGIIIESRPSPLESVFVDNPNLLANCKIGLTVDKVEQAIAGNDAVFFLGDIELVIQALPTRIHLTPATIQFGNTVYSGQARLSNRHLRYDIRE